MARLLVPITTLRCSLPRAVSTVPTPPSSRFRLPSNTAGGASPPKNCPCSKDYKQHRGTYSDERRLLEASAAACSPGRLHSKLQRQPLQQLEGGHSLRGAGRLPPETHSPPTSSIHSWFSRERKNHVLDQNV